MTMVEAPPQKYAIDERPFRKSNCFPMASCSFRRTEYKPPFPAVRCLKDADSWMKALTESNPKVTLGDFVLVGSHDSASYTISPYACGSAIGITQTESLLEQLQGGVRYLDLRLGGKNGNVFIYHGILKGGRFEDVLEDIRDFCRTHQGELVLIRIDHEFGRPFPQRLKQTAVESIRSILGDWMLCDHPEDLLKTPLSELTKTKSKLCVFASDRFQKEFSVDTECLEETYGILSASKWIQDRWHNTTDPVVLVERNLQQVKNRRANSNKLWNHQFVLTPRLSGISDLVNSLLGKTSLHPFHLANRGLYTSTTQEPPLLHKVFLEHPHLTWNIVSLDFVEMTPSIVQLCIGLNFGPFQVLWAGLRSKKRVTIVTERVRSQVVRGKCLFLHEEPDWKDRSLALVYRIGDKLYAKELRLQSNMVVILSEYNHSGTQIRVQDHPHPKRIRLEWDNGVVGYWELPDRIV